MEQNAPQAMPEPEDFLGVRTLTSKQQIYGVLTAVQKSRTPITVKFEGLEQYFTSLILKTNLDDGYLIIDEIAPELGHQLALQQRPFSIRGSHNGISLFFRPNVISGSGMENNIAFYKVDFPAEMIYQQRRTSFRAHVPTAMDIHASLVSTQQGPLKARLFDISIGGCRLNFKGEMAPEFRRGDEIQEFSLMLNNGFQLNCPLVVKHATYIKDWHETTCGLQFAGLDKSVERQIDRFVYFLQREARRLQTV